MTQGKSVVVGPELLAAVLDRLIPPEAGFPGAGEVAAGYVARQIEQGGGAHTLFDEVEQASRRRGAAGFRELPEAERDAVLREVETALPGLFEALVVQTYCGYYSYPTVIALLGLDPRPPQPRGHQLEPLDLRLLDRVRQRPPIYRTP